MTKLQMLETKFHKGILNRKTLSYEELEELRDGLKEIPPEEVQSPQDARQFIDMLSRFRGDLARYDRFHGDNYAALLNSLLSTGEDGIYSNSLRFIFELIQNVDDCDYPSEDDCSLEMKFDWNEKNGSITLTYNESGFTPFNVFAITGIAEAAKNISANRTEIGEKGIGFKSVFGVASKVLIQSGYFSFSLSKDHFTVPKAEYPIRIDSFQLVQGTKMTLTAPGAVVKEIYRRLADEYCTGDALFNKNPLLFLNKLTHLRFYYDSWRSLTFDVSRKPKDCSGDLGTEERVRVSVNLSDTFEGKDRSDTTSIECIRYTMPVVYDLEACRSRYGAKTRIAGRAGKQMHLHVVVPTPDSLNGLAAGAVYSFLPTQIRLCVPLAIHVPFKLDASREFVDPKSDLASKKNSKWFEDSCQSLAEMLGLVYTDLAKRFGTEAVRYFPAKEKSLFQITNEKVRCLSSRSEFMGARFLSLPVFAVQDGGCFPADEVTSISMKEAGDPTLVHSLLRCRKHLFIPPEDINIAEYGVEIQRDINGRLLNIAVSDETRTAACLQYLASVYDEKELAARIPKLTNVSLTLNQVQWFMQYESFRKQYCAFFAKEWKKSRIPEYRIQVSATRNITDLLPEEFEIEDIPTQPKSYLKQIDLKYILKRDVPDGSFFPAENVLILSENEALKAFADFCDRFDKQHVFSANLTIRAESQKLNEIADDDSISAEEYLERLREVRGSVRFALGNEAYQRYLTLIREAGVDSTRFLHELLQNADDCIYPNDAVPTFSLTADGRRIETKYNEVGFTKSNVRSITAIGESTKKQILNGHAEIGEKGIGFKSIFSAASEVEIHSGPFHFRLKADAPTIPVLIDAEDRIGTCMRFRMKEKSFFSISSLTETEVLQLCLCLRRLKKLSIGSFSVEIQDSPGERTLIIDNNRYVFIRTEHSFEAEQQLLAERGQGRQRFEARQSICCYIPREAPKGSSVKSRLYCGLPTSVELNVPMSIDAPFQLTTARDRPIGGRENQWNQMLKKETYRAVQEVLAAQRDLPGSGVLDLLCFEEVRTNGQKQYIPNLFSDFWLNQYDFLPELRDQEFIPTMQADQYLVPGQTSKWYPNVVKYLIRKGETLAVSPGQIIEIGRGSEDVIQRRRTVLRALGCTAATASESLSLVKPFIPSYMPDEKFRKRFYSFLLKYGRLEETDKRALRAMAIIPVCPTSGETIRFVSWREDCIFTKQNAKKSTKDYAVLNEDILSKKDCEEILGVRIDEMNREYECGRYQKSLKTNLTAGGSGEALYRYILDEFASGRIQEYDALGTLLVNKDRIPLRTKSGDIRIMRYSTDKIFIDDIGAANDSELLRKMCAAQEAESLARALSWESVRGINYEDIPARFVSLLSADDIEAFLDDNLYHGTEILRAFIADGCVSDELIEEYELQYLIEYRKSDVDEDEYEFPNEPVADRKRLNRDIQERAKNPSRIVKVKEERTVDKVNYNGKLTGLDHKEIRNRTMSRYTPANSRRDCFCQICKKVRNQMYIEVNNLESEPKCYWPEMRVSLCLNCSKWFVSFRNSGEYPKFIESVRNADCSGNRPIELKISNRTITFTQKHLAVIQEILKS